MKWMHQDDRMLPTSACDAFGSGLELVKVGVQSFNHSRITPVKKVAGKYLKYVDKKVQYLIPVYAVVSGCTR